MLNTPTILPILKNTSTLVITVYALWLVFVITLLNPLLNHNLSSLYQQQTGRALSYSLIQLNPFNLSLHAHDLKDSDPDGKTFWQLKTLVVNLSLSSLPTLGLVLDELALHDFYLYARRFQNNELSFADILRHQQLLSDTKPLNAKPVNHGPDELPSLSIHKINLSIQHLGFSDYTKLDPLDSQPFHAQLQSINLSLSDFSTLSKEGKPYHFIASDEAGGELEWQGTVSVRGKNSSGRLDLRNVSLMPAWRFKQDELGFDLLSATLSMGGDYRLSWQDLTQPDYVINNGFLSIDNYQMQAHQDPHSYLNWQQVLLSNIQLQGLSQSISMDQVLIKQLNSRLQINEDGSTNFNRMFAINSPDAVDTADSSAIPWNIDIGKIVFENNLLDFSDASLSSQFRVAIENFSGEISRISTDTTVPSSIDLHGAVDGYAPVTLLGTISPFSTLPQLDVDLGISHVDLKSVSPYSGTYAGWNIDKGLISLQLGYQLENNHLIGKNKIHIDQLKLGERTESLHLVDLPLRLAVALLTDEHGVMNLDVPVEGHIDDPQFKVGNVLWSAFRNIIIKIVKSPFKFLASVIGNDDGENLEQVPFSPGKSTLTTSVQKQLNQIKQAIDKRPILRLGIEGHYDNALDTQALQQQKMHAQLLAKNVSPEDITQQSSLFVKTINHLYQEQFPERLDVSKKERPALDTKTQQLTTAINITQTELQSLANNRASAVKRYLITELSMLASDVFILGNDNSGQFHHAKLVLEAK